MPEASSMGGLPNRGEQPSRGEQPRRGEQPSRIPPVGAPVFTRDGAALGEVSEVSGANFKVDAPKARDYWLSAEFVLQASAACVELDFDVETLDDYKLEHPAPIASESPILDAEANSFSSPEERAARRHEMEHPPAQS
jgi:hypothetical protein